MTGLMKGLIPVQTHLDDNVAGEGGGRILRHATSHVVVWQGDAKFSARVYVHLA